MTYHISTYI